MEYNERSLQLTKVFSLKKQDLDKMDLSILLISTFRIR